jgi:uncharacterized membrane protein
MPTFEYSAEEIFIFLVPIFVIVWFAAIFYFITVCKYLGERAANETPKNSR